MGSFYWTKTLGFLLLLIVNEVFESSCADGENNLGPTVISPVERVSYYEGGTSVEGVVAGTPDASDDEGTGECYRPQVIIQPPTCKSAPVKTSTLSISDVHRVIRTELHDVRRKLDAVMTFLALRSPKSSSFVPEVHPMCTTPELGEGLVSSNCSVGVDVHAGTQCTYHCDAGMTMQGDHAVSCGSDGHWIQPLPTCRVVLERDCSDAVDRGFTTSGIYLVQPTDNGEPIEVFCDMETDYGGWTVFQRRQDGSVNFYRVFATYERGFGELDGEFWLGNENLYRLTSQTNYELRVDLEDIRGVSSYAVYHSFSVGDSASNYTLEVSGYEGTAGNALGYHNNMQFSTKDRDNDNSGAHCASTFHGAWWYNACQQANLNGWYIGPENQEQSKGVVWHAQYSLKKADMKFRFTG